MIALLAAVGLHSSAPCVFDAPGRNRTVRVLSADPEKQAAAVAKRERKAAKKALQQPAALTAEEIFGAEFVAAVTS